LQTTFFARHLQMIHKEYKSLDNSRLMVLYFALCALDIMDTLEVS
jgi:hypothetical protein